MKKIFYVFAAAAVMFALSSCEKNEAPAIDRERVPDDGPVVQLSFVPEAGSRAFGSGTTEAWEKQINSATILLFRSGNDLVYRKDLTASEIASLTTAPFSLVIPGGLPKEKYAIAVVANRTVPASVQTKRLLEEEMETDAASYNGSFGDVTTKALRTGGFAMYGEKNLTIAASGSTAVSVVLRKVVAKIEVVARTTAAFAAKYGNATITISQITLSNSTSACRLYDSSGLSGAEAYTQPSVSGTNLFYIFPKLADTGSRVKLTLAAIYDMDGLTATTADRSNMSYEVEMRGDSNGRISRNGAYLVNVNIDGVQGSDVTAAVTVADWETLVTESVNVGN